MNKLESYLKHMCISQRGFAKKIGTTPNNLNLLVKGKSTPSLRLAYEIEKKSGGLVTVYDWVHPEWLDNNEDQEEIKEKSNITTVKYTLPALKK